ncbi:unnamed protein product [Citrullus colocynthis]|uniref:Uncharacterized protein n=1 Tax=Citrullus colocynthis TaxID=252529 RepID=A0ABP0Z6W4_9ROSI
MARSSHLPLPLSIFLLSFLFFFFFLCLSCNALSPDRKSNFPSSDRTLLSLQRRRDQQISNCGEKVSALQCSQTPKCRWCRSDVIDDTCFTRAEALRLPQQICCFPAVGHGFTSYLLISMYMVAGLRGRDTKSFKDQYCADCL